MEHLFEAFQAFGIIFGIIVFIAVLLIPYFVGVAYCRKKWGWSTEQSEDVCLNLLPVVWITYNVLLWILPYFISFVLRLVG